MNRLEIIIIKENDKIFGLLKGFSGVSSQGDTEEEVIENLKKYLIAYIMKMPINIERKKSTLSENRIEFLINEYNKNNYEDLSVDDLEIVKYHYIREQNYEEAGLLRDIIRVKENIH